MAKSRTEYAQDLIIAAGEMTRSLMATAAYLMTPEPRTRTPAPAASEAGAAPRRRRSRQAAATTLASDSPAAFLLTLIQNNPRSTATQLKDLSEGRWNNAGTVGSVAKQLIEGGAVRQEGQGYVVTGQPYAAPQRRRGRPPGQARKAA